MITNEREFQQALEQLARMYRALAALRDEVFPHSARTFALMAEGPLDEIQRLIKQIDDYTGATEARQKHADAWLGMNGPA